MWKRFFLVENYPLYFMLVTAATMAIYTPLLHLKEDPEITSNPNERVNFLDKKDKVHVFNHVIYEWMTRKSHQK